MYTSYFGLNENPFSIAPDPLYLYMSEQHREALAHLKYGVRSDGGFVLLTGEVGAGKTTLCRSLLEQLPENVVIAFVLNPKVSVIELLETVCDELHIERPENGSIKQLVDRLNSYLLEANAQGRKTVLIIDEAQNLSVDVLEQLRLLTNLETNRYKLLQIVLLGQPELLQILNRQEMRQLSQRVTARYHLGPIGIEEIGSYVRHRLNIAGCHRPIFPEGLDKDLWRLTGGIPRLINLVCDRALLGAYVLECKEVDSKILSQAAQEVLGGSSAPVSPKRPALLAGLVLIVLALALAGVWARQTLSSATTDRPVAAASDPAAPIAAVTAETPAPAAASGSSAKADTLPRSWPQDFATTQDLRDAFADLAGLWGLPSPEELTDPCTYAGENGLGCLARKDSLAALRSINRPAILTLYADNGKPFHVVLSGLEEGRAEFVAGGESRALAIAAIESRWFGEYFLLWQWPPFQPPLLQPGDAGEAVSWLAETLQELGLYAATGGEVRLEGALLGAFKRFQFNNGLTPDGVLGAMSLIHLNTARSLVGPRLTQRGAG